MIEKSTPHVSKIVLPAPEQVAQPSSQQFANKPFPWPHMQLWAPAWFYSAINWLGKSYYDASKVQQKFNSYMVGSDVDPYAHLGSTCLFRISRDGDTFNLSLAANATAPLSSGTSYPNTDAGITQMYTDLAASPIFPLVKYCYIPGKIGPDLDPTSNVDRPSLNGLNTGYDPGTGLRAVVLGSAVAQVVPFTDFTATHNEQIYNGAPAIVPVVTALVYDVRQYNTLGATTFVLPVYYTRDQAAPGEYYVSKLGSATQLNNTTVDYGQTVLLPGGPGYDETAAASLHLNTTTATALDGDTFTTYVFDKAKVTTVAATNSTVSPVWPVNPVNPKVQTGVMSLTYASPSPAGVFANQRIAGFYRDANWETCLGVPIYDFGPGNASFTATSTALHDPVLVYDPTHPLPQRGVPAKCDQAIRSGGLHLSARPARVNVQCGHYRHRRQHRVQHHHGRPRLQPRLGAGSPDHRAPGRPGHAAGSQHFRRLRGRQCQGRQYRRPAVINYRQLALRLLQFQRGHRIHQFGQFQQRLPRRRRYQLGARQSDRASLCALQAPAGSRPADPNGVGTGVRVHPGGRQRPHRAHPLHAQRDQPRRS